MDIVTHHWQRLALLADVIVPRTAAMPSARDIDLVPDALLTQSCWNEPASDAGTEAAQTPSPIETALQARPDARMPLRVIIERMSEDDARTPETASSFIERLEREDPGAHMLLIQIVAGAYYMDARIRLLIGYAGQKDQQLPAQPRPSPGMAAARRKIGTAPRYRDIDASALDDG